MSITTRRPAEVLREALAQYLGSFTAANAIKLYARQALSTDPEQVTAVQVPALLDALTPTLRTLMGKDTAERVITELRQEFGG